MKRIQSIAISLLFISPLVGQEVDTLKLKEVEIKSLLRNDVMSLIQEINADGTEQSLGNLLQEHSSVYVKNYGPGSLSTLSLRGASSSQTQVVWNGIQLNNPLNGQSDISLLPIFLVNQASIQKGNLDGGFGGKLLLQHDIPKYENRNLEFHQQVGSFGYLGTGINGWTNIKGTNLFLSLYNIQSENNFLFTNTAQPGFPEERQKNAAFMQRGFKAETQSSLKRGNLESLIWLQSFNRELPNIMSYRGRERIELQNDQDLRAYASYTHYWSSQKLLISYHLNLLENTYERLGNFSEVLVANVQSQSKVQQHIPKISTNIRKGNFETTLLARSQIERAQFYSMDALGNQVSRNIVALSNQSSWYLGTTSLELNATVQAYKESTPLYSGRIAFSSPLSPGLRADLSIEQNLRIPTLNDLYWRPGGNPNLQPEQARSIELGTYWQGIKTSRNLHATLFYRQTQQWIQWRPTEFAFWRPFNLDQVTSFGLDASFSWSDIAVGNSGMLAKEELVLGLNRSYLCADASKHQLMYIPKITANFWQYLKWHAVEIAAGLQFVGERETETAEEFQSFHRLEPFVLLHSKIAYQIGRKYCDLKLAFSVNNLLDRPYQNILWRAMPGRNFNLSFVLLI